MASRPHFVAEITARTGRDPGALYRELTKDLGEPGRDRVRRAERRPEACSRSSPPTGAATILPAKKIEKTPDARAGKRCADRRPESVTETLVRRTSAGTEILSSSTRGSAAMITCAPFSPRAQAIVSDAFAAAAGTSGRRSAPQPSATAWPWKPGRTKAIPLFRQASRSHRAANCM